MAKIPMSYDEINEILGHYSPSMIRACDNASFSYWVRSLTQRIISRLKTELPSNWEGSRRDFLLKCLILGGYVFVSKNNKLGYWFQPGHAGGELDFYYQPTLFLIGNPRAYELDVKDEYIIHEEGELLKFMPDYNGFYDVITKFAIELSALDNAINMTIINSKMPFVLGAKNKGTAQTLKMIMDKINRGDPAIIYDKAIGDDPNDKGNTPFQYLELFKLKDNYILDKQLVDRQTIINAFDAEIGITTVPYQKAERMVTSESESKTEDSQARIMTAIETLKSSIKDIKKLYPDITLDFNLRETEVSNNGNNNIERGIDV